MFLFKLCAFFLVLFYLFSCFIFTCFIYNTSKNYWAGVVIRYAFLDPNNNRKSVFVK